MERKKNNDLKWVPRKFFTFFQSGKLIRFKSNALCFGVSPFFARVTFTNPSKVLCDQREHFWPKKTGVYTAVGHFVF